MTRTERCDSCQGEGFAEFEIPGGRYDPRMDQYYPHHETMECGACHGYGYIERHYCPDCRALKHHCRCERKS